MIRRAVFGEPKPGGARFAAARDQAKAGAFDDWAETPEGVLALLILLDQLSRNLFRGSAEAFAAEASRPTCCPRPTD